jgi:putative thioredoxin
MLEAEVHKANGIVRLLKLNVDEQKELASALQIKSLPSVFLLQGGRAVSNFTGVPRPADLEKFMEQACARGRMACGDVTPPKPVHSSPAFLLKNAAKALADKNVPAAAQLYTAVLSDAEQKAHHAAAIAGLARCALADKQIDVAKDLVATVRAEHKEALLHNAELESALASVELACSAGGAAGDAASGEDSIDALQTALLQTPDDHAKRHALALKQFAAGDAEAALNGALELFKRDRNWNDGAAKKTCLDIFKALGDTHPTTKAGRRRLSNLMFV